MSSSVVDSPVADTVDQLIADEEKVFLRRQPRSSELIAEAQLHRDQRHGEGFAKEPKVAQPRSIADQIEVGRDRPDRARAVWSVGISRPRVRSAGRVRSRRRP